MSSNTSLIEAIASCPQIWPWPGTKSVSLSNPENFFKVSRQPETVAFSDEIQVEDAAICEIVQKNLVSRSYDRGRYSVKQERGVHAFHRRYAAAMGGG
jgi:phenylpropionate dioxygenase-like ring-hydroxylating dioxygenase large terminal subunit